MGTGFIRGYGAAIGRTVIAIGSLVTLAAAVLAFILLVHSGRSFVRPSKERATSRRRSAWTSATTSADRWFPFRFRANTRATEVSLCM